MQFDLAGNSGRGTTAVEVLGLDVAAVGDEPRPIFTYISHLAGPGA